MNLADSWLEDVPTATPVEAFHDEVEEVDEVDEAEDGCGGVVWQPYVLTKASTSNKMLHELAREVRGVEKRRGKRLTVAQYQAHFCERDTIILLNFSRSWIALPSPKAKNCRRHSSERSEENRRRRF